MSPDEVARALVGAWSLVRYQVSVEDGQGGERVVFPLGERATGLLSYAEGGTVTALLSADTRASLGVDTLEEAHKASEAARAAAFDTYLAYGGTYRIEGDEVVHTLELSLQPDTVGTSQRRRFALDGRTLSLSYTSRSRSGRLRRHELVWARRSP